MKKRDVVDWRIAEAIDLAIRRVEIKRRELVELEGAVPEDDGAALVANMTLQINLAQIEQELYKVALAYERFRYGDV